MPKSRNMNNSSSRRGRQTPNQKARAIVEAIAIAPRLAWVKPFLVQAAPLVPLHRLRSIEAYSAKGRGQDFTQGLTHHYRGKFYITLTTKVRMWPKGHSERGMGALLEVLSHELAHTKEWEHTPERWLLELRISRKFAILAKKMGIKDLEQGVISDP